MIGVRDAELRVLRPDKTATNLTNHWPLNDEVGTAAGDVVGTADATAKGDVSLGGGSELDGFPTASFDGTGDYLSITTKSYGTAGELSQVTVAGWVNTSFSGDIQTIISFDDFSYWELAINNDTGEARWVTTDSTDTTDALIGTTDLTDGNWHFVVGTFDVNASPQKRLIVDGTEENTSSPHGTSSIGDGNTRFGFIGVGSEASAEDGTVNNNHLNGELATIFIYEGTALSTADINTIWNAGRIIQTPSFTVPGADLLSVDISRRAEDRKDTGRMEIENNDGTYNVGQTNQIRSGDRLRFRVKLEGETSFETRWFAMARQVVYETTSATQSRVIVKAEDFVFGVMSQRVVENSFEGQALEDMMSKILNGNASELWDNNIEKSGETTDANFNGTNLLEAFTNTLKQGSMIVSDSMQSPLARKVGSLETKFTLKDSDKRGHVIRHDDEKLTNRVRLKGGKDTALDEEQATQSAFTTVTDTSRITHQLTTAKAEVAKIAVHTKKTGSGEGVKVRLQKNEGGAPIDETDSTLDIASTTVEAEDLKDDDLTVFTFDRHTLPEPSPWMIIESTGATGQDIGTDGSGNPTFQGFYPFLIITQSEDADSQEKFRVRGFFHVDESIKTRTEASDRAKTITKHQAKPEVILKFIAESKRASRLEPLDKIIADLDNIDGTKGFIITLSRSEYEGHTLTVSIEAQQEDTI